MTLTDPGTRAAASSEAVALYLDLMKRALTRSISNRNVARYEYPKGSWRRLVHRPLRWLLGLRGLEMVRIEPLDRSLRAEGRDWPWDAETMIGLRRLDNLQACVEDCLAKGVPGDLIETGVWRGGATIFMRAVLRAHGDTTRRVWLADSFEGLPKPDAATYPADRGDTLWSHVQLAVPLEEVKANFERYGLLDDQVRFLKGWFKDTLPTAPIERLAVLRLDGDMYESTMDALRALYPKLSPGGYVIVDDYGLIPACRQAVEDYRREQGIQDEIRKIDWSGVYWRRSG